MNDIEKRAHDLAIAYEMLSVIKSPVDYVEPTDFVSNYENSYDEILSMLED